MLNERIQSILNEGILKNVYGGASVLVYKGGKELIYAQAGCQDKELGTPITRESLFRIYSMTKPITGAAGMLLVERGQLDMEAPVSDFLPGFKNQQYFKDGKLEPVTKAATVADLFAMTSGLTYPGEYDQSEVLMGELWKEFEQTPMDTVTLCNRMGQIPLPFAPGTCWRYGFSADVLGAVIEVVSGKPYQDFLRDELFTPLEMNDTGFFVEPENTHRLATVYERDEAGGLVPFTKRHLGAGGLCDIRPGFASGGGGLVSSINDYMRFGQMLLNKGTFKGNRILGPETVAFMASPQLNPEQMTMYWEKNKGYNYGRLMAIRTEKGLAPTLGNIGEYGWSGWLGTQFINDPVQNLTFVFMTQCKDTAHAPLTNRLRNAIHGAL